MSEAIAFRYMANKRDNDDNENYYTVGAHSKGAL